MSRLWRNRCPLKVVPEADDDGSLTSLRHAIQCSVENPHPKAIAESCHFGSQLPKHPISQDVWDVLHHHEAGPEFPNQAEVVSRQTIHRVIGIPGTGGAKALARRAAHDAIYLAPVCYLTEPVCCHVPDVLSNICRIRVVRQVRVAAVRIIIYKSNYVEATMIPKPISYPADACE